MRAPLHYAMFFLKSLFSCIWDIEYSVATIGVLERFPDIF